MWRTRWAMAEIARVVAGQPSHAARAPERPGSPEVSSSMPLSEPWALGTSNSGQVRVDTVGLIVLGLLGLYLVIHLLAYVARVAGEMNGALS